MKEYILNTPRQKWIKRITIFFSAVMMMFGVVLGCSGLWFVINRAFSTEVLNSALFLIAGIALACVGFALLILGALSIWAVVSENRWVVLGVVILLVLGLIVSVIAGVFSVIYPATMTSMARSAMAFTLTQNYAAQQIITQAWDDLQTKLRCCAVDDAGWLLYRQSYWIRVENKYPNVTGIEQTFSEISPYYRYVPASCCLKFNDPFWFYHTMYGQYRSVSRCQTWKLGPPSQQLGGYNDALYYRGCLPAAQDYLSGHSIIITIFGLVFAVFILIEAVLNAIVFVMLLMHKNEDDSAYQGVPGQDQIMNPQYTGAGSIPGDPEGKGMLAMRMTPTGSMGATEQEHPAGMVTPPPAPGGMLNRPPPAPNWVALGQAPPNVQPNM